MQSSQSNNLLEFLAKYWFLVFFIGGMAVTWGSFSQRINILESRVIILESNEKETRLNLSDVKGGIIRIETSLQFIKEKLDD